jgi:hypothetical protein
MTPKFGQWVTCTAKLYRASRTEFYKAPAGYIDRRHLKYWARLPVKTEGLFIGFRTLYDGVNKWDEDCGNTFYPKSHFTAALVVPGPRRKPILVPMDAVKIKSTEFEVVEPCKQKNCFDCDGNEWKGRECIKCTGTITRPLTPDEINLKFNQWWEYITEYCTPCGEKGPCMREGCDLWPYVSINSHPIRKVKP